MEENQNLAQQEKRPDQENPIIAFFVNLCTAIKLPFSIPQKKNDNSKKKIESADGPQADLPITNKPTVSVVEDDVAVAKTGVTFPTRSENFSQLKLEAQGEDAERSTNPLLIWQVYAIGGFFVLKWAWSRWNERKGQKKSGDEPPPTDD